MTVKGTKMVNSEDVVISGISGVFPNSDNVEEFKENLLAGNDMISSVNRWQSSDEDAPRRIGVLKSVNRFDHSFFRVTRSHAEGMIVGLRLLLEKTFEAVLDAGYNLQQIKGKNIAVICGLCDSSIEEGTITEAEDFVANIGKTKFMLANRISYWLDVNGPSVTLDTACSSSIYAIDYGFKLIQKGECEGAIICAPNICTRPEEDSFEPGTFSADGTSRPFDADANGFVRGEAVVAVFLQKKSQARRIYAHLVHSKTNCDGFKKEGISHPSKKQQMQLYKKFYEEVNIDPSCVSYIETHGTGTQVGDITEGNSIEEFFCTDRKSPLKIGSIKSNMGHAEGASGLSALVKMIISFETGTIPPTLNFKNPNPKIKGLQDGQLEMITKLTPLEGEYFAINSFGLGGANGHILLTPHHKKKNVKDLSADDGLPRLVTVSGRTEEAVDYILNNVEKHKSDYEYIRLLHEIFSEDISGHLQRGYTILYEDKEPKKSKKFLSGEKRPIWFIFAGMGSQWPAMGESLMKIPIFNESIQKSHDTLQTKGINLIEIVTKNDPEMFNNILNSFIGIAAIQIALVDVLKALDIHPDGIIGHSVGELGCAYADGCFTAEQMILAAYYRGLVSLETEFIHGTMAAVGQGYTTFKDLLPPDIDIACHNGPTSCTISGPTDKMEEFIEEIKNKKIFVRKVNTGNIAYHSRYIASAAPTFIQHLRNIIPEPKLRSEKWICTSVPEPEWNTEATKYSSAEYHTTNLLSPVYFEEGCRHIPSNAIAIEIAPHGLLNAILKRSLPPTVENIPLTLRNHENEVEFFLMALGQLYEAGGVPKLSNLYPPVEFPVSRSTPMISPLIKWQHDEQWLVSYIDSEESMSGERDVFVTPQSDDFDYLVDHIIDDRNLYPVLGYLRLVWETVAIIQRKKINSVPVIFENVRFERATNVPKKGIIQFHVIVHPGTNNFEVTENGAIVASGIVRTSDNISKEIIDVTPFEDETYTPDNLPLNNKDFYKELKLRGYQYKGLFRKVVRANSEGTYGRATWCNNFVTFMDTMIQISILNADCRDILVPISIRKLVIDVNKHFEILSVLDAASPELPINFYPNLDILHSGGIQISGLKTNQIPRRPNQINPTLEKYEFIPYISNEMMDFNSVIRLCVQIILENTHGVKVKSCEIPDQDESNVISNVVAETLAELPLIQANINILTDSENMTTPTSPEVQIIKELSDDGSYSLIIQSNIGKKMNRSKQIFAALKDDGFIITKESSREKIYVENLGFNVCFSCAINADEKILLLQKIADHKGTTKAIKIKSDCYSWFPEIKSTLAKITSKKHERLIIYAEKDPKNGILGLFNCLRKEENGRFVRCFYVMDKNAPSFSLENPLYKSQLNKNLSQNIYKNGQWGSYRYSRLNHTQTTEVIHAFCTMEKHADLSSFTWLEDSLDPLTYEDSNGKSLVHVYYSGLNFGDVMLSVGKISASTFSNFNRFHESLQGAEFSGKDRNGRRVMGILRNKGVATLIETIPDLFWTVPENMTLQEAASIPIAYATVIYAFFLRMQLEKGSSILIHAGTGAIGQAAINICLYYKCKIFTTVGTPKDIEFLKKTFPQIPESHISNSKDTSFEKFIMEKTNGKGVDVVLNSLAEEKLRASVRCVGLGGHFLEIGKYDMSKNNPLEMGHFLNDITFHSVQLDRILWDCDETATALGGKFQEMLDYGIIKPITRTVFSANEVEQAFRCVATEKHVGKVVIKIREEEKDLNTKPKTIRMKAKPRVLCKKNKSYIIIGGLSGFGLELADWLILRGARSIVLNSKTEIQNGYQSYRIKLWRSYGVNAIISTDDVTKQSGVESLLRRSNSLSPVGGIFNTAAILRDDPIHKQSEESFKISTDPKAIATMYLDTLSRKMCPHLEHFVVFSSAASARGNLNRTNYGYSDSIVERICESRKSENLPALAIQWGSIKEISMMDNLIEDDRSVAIGTLQQSVRTCLNSLNILMKQQNPIVSSTIVAKKCENDTNIFHTTAKILGIEDINTINHSTTLLELGMDSILEMELRQILESEFNTFFTAEDLRNTTFAKLYKLKEDRTTAEKSANETSQTQHNHLKIDENILKNSKTAKIVMDCPLRNEKIMI